jgi:DNA-binding MarR family transcriptional regulator/GNAT superfamily N-acetyltransferase
VQYLPRAPPEVGVAVDAVRRFSRFYTAEIGALGEAYLGTPWSLTEARVLYELAHRDGPTASELSNDLRLDPGYTSRILRRFRSERLLGRQRSTADGREVHLGLTTAGARAFADLDRRTREQLERRLEGLTVANRARLGSALDSVREVLGGSAGPAPTVTIRTHRPGDLGWIVQRHGALYAEEYGWDATFEALVASIASGFLRTFDPRRERCWIAEQGGVAVGCVLCARRTDTTAQLRLLLVDPAARGIGVGRRLVAECIAFARAAGYRKITLWTNDVLVAARRIYQEAGFQRRSESPHHSFGRDLVGQNWDLSLDRGRPKAARRARLAAAPPPSPHSRLGDGPTPARRNLRANVNPRAPSGAADGRVRAARPRRARAARAALHAARPD